MNNIIIKDNLKYIKKCKYIKIIKNSDFYWNIEIQKQIGSNFSILKFNTYNDIERIVPIKCLINIEKISNNYKFSIPIENNTLVCDYEDENYTFIINISANNLNNKIILQYGPIEINKKFYEIKKTIKTSTIYHKVYVYSNEKLNMNFNKLLWKDNSLFLIKNELDKSLELKTNKISKLNKMRNFPYKFSIIINNDNLILEFGSFTEKQTIYSLINDNLKNKINFNLKEKKNYKENNISFLKKKINNILFIYENNINNINENINYFIFNNKDKIKNNIEKLNEFQFLYHQKMKNINSNINNLEIKNDILKIREEKNKIKINNSAYSIDNINPNNNEILNYINIINNKENEILRLNNCILYLKNNINNILKNTNAIVNKKINKFENNINYKLTKIMNKFQLNIETINKLKLKNKIKNKIINKFFNLKNEYNIWKFNINKSLDLKINYEYELVKQINNKFDILKLKLKNINNDVLDNIKNSLKDNKEKIDSLKVDYDILKSSSLDESIVDNQKNFNLWASNLFQINEEINESLEKSIINLDIKSAIIIPKNLTNRNFDNFIYNNLNNKIKDIKKEYIIFKDNIRKDLEYFYNFNHNLLKDLNIIILNENLKNDDFIEKSIKYKYLKKENKKLKNLLNNTINNIKNEYLLYKIDCKKIIRKFKNELFLIKSNFNEFKIKNKSFLFTINMKNSDSDYIIPKTKSKTCYSKLSNFNEDFILSNFFIDKKISSDFQNLNDFLNNLNISWKSKLHILKLFEKIEVEFNNIIDNDKNDLIFKDNLISELKENKNKLLDELIKLKDKNLNDKSIISYTGSIKSSFSQNTDNSITNLKNEIKKAKLKIKNRNTIIKDKNLIINQLRIEIEDLKNN